MVMDVVWRRLCVSKGVGNYLLRAVNVWWRCAQYFIIVFVVICLETIDVCIWGIFVCMSVVVTVWSLREVCCVAAVVKDSVFSD